jgi:hypothetical protein
MRILVDPQYNPDLQGAITSNTKLGPGITCAKFLGARGSRTQFEKLYADSFFGSADRKQIARNLVLHANAIQTVLTNPEFAQHRLIVSEGIYEPNPKFEIQEIPAGTEGKAKRIARQNDGASYGKGPDGWIARVPVYVGETPTSGSINDLRRTGRAVVYQLIDKNGKTDPEKTFDLAVYWKDYIDYDKLILDYDTYDPNGDLTSQIVLVMPKVPSSYEVSFDYDLETTYNNELQTKNELLEILPEDPLEDLSFNPTINEADFDDIGGA